MNQGEGLLRVVYFSRNRIKKPVRELKLEISSILICSQVNNLRRGVTGALMFNQGVFGQVLEGPSLAVEETLESIAADERHFDVTVLDITKVETRSFENWSMGFIGNNNEAEEAFGRSVALSHFDTLQASGLAIFNKLRDLALRNELSAGVI